MHWAVKGFLLLVLVISGHFFTPINATNGEDRRIQHYYSESSTPQLLALLLADGFLWEAGIAIRTL